MPVVFCAACASDPPERAATLTLANQTWTAGALFSDKLDEPSIEIHLAHSADLGACSWYGPQSVDLLIGVDSRAAPHVLPRIDLAGSTLGAVIYNDAEDSQLAVSGVVFPTLTAWGAGAAGATDRIEEIDGTLDVVLADGRRLSGTFAADVCR